MVNCGLEERLKHQRAIEEREKQERRGFILKAAAGLLDAGSFEAVSIQSVARSAGIAKGTVYLYFHTKEELFLAVLDEEFEVWFEELRQAIVHRLGNLAAGSESVRIETLTAQVTASLEGRPRLLSLLPILHPILEHNVSFETALSFKQSLLRNLLESGAVIETSLGFLRAGQGAELLLSAYASLIGLQSMAGQTPAVRAVLAREEMAPFRVEVMTALPRMLRRILEGYRIENTR